MGNDVSRRKAMGTLGAAALAAGVGAKAAQADEPTKGARSAAAAGIQRTRPAGLAPTKGPRLQEALQTITERQGEISLAFLRDKPLEEARNWLLDLNGVVD